MLFHDLELHHPVGQEPQTPTGLTLRWLATGERDKRASCSPSSLRWYSRLGARRFRAASKPSSKYCLRTLADGRLAHLHSICNPLIYPARALLALVGFEQDASMGELAGWGCASGDQALQVVSFSVS